MPLIITAVDKGRMVQVPARRLTYPNSEVYDHGANKAVCIDMGYVHFATSYIEGAYIGDHGTSRLLLGIPGPDPVDAATGGVDRGRFLDCRREEAFARLAFELCVLRTQDLEPS